MKCNAENDDWRAGHDWVLVANRSADITVDNDKGLLWACPCGEFKWTSYAEWEKGREIPPSEAYQSPEALDTSGARTLDKISIPYPGWTKP